MTVTELTGNIFDIQHFCVHDGPGIRTTVFLSGCPLKCLWCHNPEGQSFEPSVRFFEEKCIMCGACVPACPGGSHKITDGCRLFDRFGCALCYECVRACPAGALLPCHREYTVDEVFEEVMKDRVFYGDDGGVTVSGGEALCRPEFVTALLKKCRENGITTAVDTCGAIPYDNIKMTVPYTDTYLYDIKAADPVLHAEGCGCGNRLILENLRRLDGENKDIRIRVPVVGSFNATDGEMTAIADIVGSLSSVSEVTLIPYHSFGKGKYASLGRTAPDIASPEVSDVEIKHFKEIFVSKGLRVK